MQPVRRAPGKADVELWKEPPNAGIFLQHVMQGDVMVTCIIGCALQGFTPESALEAAYNKISKRDGRMVDGQFVRHGK